jgi:hypothetical protein
VRLRQLIANYLTIASGIIAGFLSFAVLIILAIDWFYFTKIDVPVYCWRFLLWPGYLMGRIGFSHTWIAVLIVAIGGLILFFRYLGGSSNRIRKFFIAFIFILLYEFLGFSYFYWFPVPAPAFSLSYPVIKNWDLYVRAYETGYRCGIIDRSVSYHGPGISKEMTEGYMLGYEMGTSEWESIAPGLIVSEVRELVDRFSNTEINQTDVQDVDASEGIPMRELGQCRIDFTEIGRRASFSGTAIYQAIIDADGVITDLKAINGVDFLSQFVQIEQFESCVKRWRFAEEGEYTLILIAGTTGKTLEEGWKIQVRKAGKSLTIRLRGSAVS